jgi:hypothetical protein
MGSSGRGCDWGRCTVVVSEGVCGSGGRFGECTEVLGTHALVLGMYGATTRPLPWGAWEVCPSLILSPAGGVRDQEPDIPATLLSFTRPSSQAAVRVWISLCPLVGPFRRPYLSLLRLWSLPLVGLHLSSGFLSSVLEVCVTLSFTPTHQHLTVGGLATLVFPSLHLDLPFLLHPCDPLGLSPGLTPSPLQANKVYSLGLG